MNEKTKKAAEAWWALPESERMKDLSYAAFLNGGDDVITESKDAMRQRWRKSEKL